MPPRPLTHPLVRTWGAAWFAGLALFAVAGVAADELPRRERVEHDGIAAELRIEARHAGPVPLDESLRVSLRLSDAASGEPLRGLRPRLWMSRHTTGKNEACGDQVRRFAAGRLSQRADRDLNGFQFVTLNADATVSVINPQIQLNNTKLEALIPLPGQGADWVYSSSHDLLAVSVPELGEVAVLDMTRHRIVKRIALGPASRPTRLLLADDQASLWVGLDGNESIAVLDLPTRTERARIGVGPGAKRFARSPDGSQVLVSSGRPELSLVNSRAPHPVRTITLSAPAQDMAVSGLSRRAYVAVAATSTLMVIDTERAAVTERITLPAPLDVLRADPSGRFLIGLNTGQDKLLAIDTSTGSVVAASTLSGGPDQVAFSQRFAYVRLAQSHQLTLVDLGELGQGKLATSAVPFFQRPAGSAVGAGAVGDLMVASPEGDSMVVGNPADAALYYYTEGMMAPQGSYRTYGRALRALMVVDRSLREVAPGTYSLAVRLDRSGRYSLPMLLNQPRLIHCFALDVEGSGADEEQRIDVRLRIAGASSQVVVPAGVEQPIEIELTDRSSGQPIAGVADLQLMVLELPGLSQERVFLRETEPGRYQVSQRFRNPGRWRIGVQSQARGLSFDPAASLDVRVSGAAPRRETP